MAPEVGLLNSFPSLTGPRREMHGIPGRPPDLSAVAPGCSFAPRCPYRAEVCDRIRPGLVARGADGQAAACHAYDRDAYGAATPAALLGGTFHPVATAEVLDA